MKPDNLSWLIPEFSSSWFRAMFKVKSSTFEETVGKLITLSRQDPTKSTDQYKVSVEFEGTYNGERFTLYDYKEDREIHIGGNDKLDVEGLQRVLTHELSLVGPTPYTAVEYYDQQEGHAFP